MRMECLSCEKENALREVRILKGLGIIIVELGRVVKLR